MVPEVEDSIMKIKSVQFLGGILSRKAAAGWYIMSKEKIGWNEAGEAKWGPDKELEPYSKRIRDTKGGSRWFYIDYFPSLCVTLYIFIYPSW